MAASLPFAFQENLKPGVTDFQPFMRGLLPPAKCVVSQMCLRLRGCRHHATPGRQTILHTSVLHMQDHRHTLCSSSHPLLCLAAFLPAQPYPRAPLYFQSHTYYSMCFFHHLYTCTHMCSLIPRHSFTHLHFLLHPHSLWHCFPYDAQQLLPTRPAGTHSCSQGPHALCLWMPRAVTKLLLVQFSHVCVLSDTHLQSSGPEQDQHVSGLKINMPGTSPFSKHTPWYHSPQGDQSVV